MILFDFRCAEHGTFERLVKSDVLVTTCPECSAQCERLVSMPTVKLEGVTGDFPGAAISWAKKHEKAAKQAAKANPDNWDN